MIELSQWLPGTMMTDQTTIRGCQSIHAPSGEVLFPGRWNSLSLLNAVTGPLGDEYWRGRRVLDIGANTSGLSIELARRGASVLAIEPDPYGMNKGKAVKIVSEIISQEGLDIELRSEGLFDAHRLGAFDTVMCLGLIYHFRSQQFVLDYLSTVKGQDLIISNQTCAGDDLIMANRLSTSAAMSPERWEAYEQVLAGWHPTHALFKRMIEFAGFTDVIALTDPSVNFPKKPVPGVTNSAYYHARFDRVVDPIASQYMYLGR
ncbi:DUF1698 domain-containing protein [Hyphomonadaceae bacterium ML37]|nr:DUF1698 domain-containing protein [Hyphomonadaceae bacterium ML37]